MTCTDVMVRDAISRGLHTADEVAAITGLTVASVTVSLEILAKSGIVFMSRESGRWWKSERGSMIVRAA